LPETFADVIAREDAAVRGGHRGCGKTCDDGCHGVLRCVRLAHVHRHAPETIEHDDGSVTVLPVDIVPHAGYTSDGTLVQWTCKPDDHDGLTDAERRLAASTRAAAERVSATHELLARVDPALMLELLTAQRDQQH
jgi:hypothetical protein